MMFEQGAEFKKFLRLQAKQGGAVNNNPQEQPRYEIEGDVNYDNAILYNGNYFQWDTRYKKEDDKFDIAREIERTKLKEDLEKKMQEQFRMLRGPNPYGPMSVNDLCIRPYVVIPKDFKIPEFIKFNGCTNPMMHLRMYCTKMGV